MWDDGPPGNDTNGGAMSRHGYEEDVEYHQGAQNFWRANVDRAITGKRGQAFLREMLAALDALPEKRLIREELVITAPLEPPSVCAIGSVGLARGLDMTKWDSWNYYNICNRFGIARVLVQEIEYENDDRGNRYMETPEERWHRMRDWVVKQIKEPAP